MLFRTWAFLLACSPLLIACKPRSAALPALKIAGVAVAHVHQRGRGYGSGQTASLYPHLKKLGVNTVQLNTFAYQPDIKTIKLSYNDPTLTLKDLENEIRLAKKYGLAVMLKPHIWLGSFSSSQWRNQIRYENAEDVDAWFRQYARFILQQSRVARDTGVEHFVIGTELVGLTGHTEKWLDLVKNIKKTGYGGKLTYACEAWNARNIKFWDMLDYIGLDFYYGVSNNERDNFEALVKALVVKIKSHRLHARALGKPLVFTEVGFPAHGDAWYKPHSWPSPGVPASDEKQRLAYQALHRAFLGAGFADGVFAWKYVTTLNSYERQNYEKGFILQNKPAEIPLKKILYHYNE